MSIRLCSDLQVVLSYLRQFPPDTESSQAALEAYFTEPLQALADTTPGPQPQSAASFAEFQQQARQLRDAISQAQAATQLGSLAAVQLGLQAYPVSLADRALEDAIRIISSHADGTAVKAPEAALKEGAYEAALVHMQRQHLFVARLLCVHSSMTRRLSGQQGLWKYSP